MLELSNLAIPLKTYETHERDLPAFLTKKVAKLLKVQPTSIQNLELARKSIDARKKNNVQFILTLRFNLREDQQEVLDRCKKLSGGARIKAAQRETFATPLLQDKRKVGNILVVGGGCAGLFATYILARAGAKPIMIERGRNAQRRARDIDDFARGGDLNTESNVQFGIGGAGTYSDGKLNTGTKSKSHRFILETFVKAGAHRDILYDAKPHIGSDVLSGVVTQMCKEIISMGGTILTSTRMTDLDIQNHQVKGVMVISENPETGTLAQDYLSASQVILATGHSARDVFQMLYEKQVMLERKTFAVGVRIEHLQSQINRSQYGADNVNNPCLGAAPYKLVAHPEQSRSAFSFCMCPGGYVVAATSEREAVVTNGMSYQARAGINANSGLLANVRPEDLGGDSPLAGIALQRRLEHQAYLLGGEDYSAPAQLLGDFLQGVASRRNSGSVQPTYPRGVVYTDLTRCLPDYVANALRASIPLMARQLRGFDSPEAVLTGVESRSSSPIRITRNESCQALGIRGLWPAGEGAGYAGGIMSAAADGIRVATALIQACNGQ